MGAERLELSRAVQAQRILSPSRLPFRHAPYNYQFLWTVFYYIMPSKKWQGVNLNFLPLPKWVRVVGRNRDYPKTAYVAKLNQSTPADCPVISKFERSLPGDHPWARLFLP